MNKLFYLCLSVFICGCSFLFAQKSKPTKPIPEFMPGDECLFCHRYGVGVTWQKNSHGITLRQREDAPGLAKILEGQPALAPQVEYFLGSRHRVRFLKKAGYGKLALLSTQVELNPVRWLGLDRPVWAPDRFADRCAGCHATAVDSSTRTFAAFGLECYTCHGVVPGGHTSDTSLVWLSKKHANDALAVTSICAQCHLRTGKSRSTGLPYANNFVAGENLFEDYEVDFSEADDTALNPGDRHVLRAVREVIVDGSQTVTCLTCHRVHEQTTARHWTPFKGKIEPICLDCHSTKGPRKPSYTIHSALCEY